MPRYDHGTERAQAMQALYGTDGCDAIGRAYRAGLLGDLRNEGQEAKALLDTARNLSNAYWQAYENGKFASPLADRTFGSVVDIDHVKVRRREKWLRESLEFVRSMGSDVDRAFRQLVIDVNPDSGPAWLDRLCYCKRTNLDTDPVDGGVLRKALDGLEQLTR